MLRTPAYSSSGLRYSHLRQNDVEYVHSQELRAREEAKEVEAEEDKAKKKKPGKAEGGGKGSGAAGSGIRHPVAAPLVQVDAELPMSLLDEDEEAAIMGQLRARAAVGSEALPSCAFFTFVNTHQVSLRCVWQRGDHYLPRAGPGWEA